MKAILLPPGDQDGELSWFGRSLRTSSSEPSSATVLML